MTPSDTHNEEKIEDKSENILDLFMTLNYWSRCDTEKYYLKIWGFIRKDVSWKVSYDCASTRIIEIPQCTRILYANYLWDTISSTRIIFTTRKWCLRRLCFHRCLSIHGGDCASQHALGQTPNWADTLQTDTPTWQTPTHPGQTPPWADTPPLCSACWDTVNKRAVRITLKCSNFVSKCSHC